VAAGADIVKVAEQVDMPKGCMMSRLLVALQLPSVAVGKAPVITKGAQTVVQVVSAPTLVPQEDTGRIKTIVILAVMGGLGLVDKLT
jgi:hypothetical protein